MNHDEPNRPHSRSGHDPCGYPLPGGGTDRQRSRSGRSSTGTGYAAALRRTQRAEDTQEDARKRTNAQKNTFIVL